MNLGSGFRVRVRIILGLGFRVRFRVRVSLGSGLGLGLGIGLVRFGSPPSGRHNTRTTMTECWLGMGVSIILHYNGG